MVKPDQLIKRRGKLGLIKVNTDLAGVKAWVTERMNQETQVCGRETTGLVAALHSVGFRETTGLVAALHSVGFARGACDQIAA